jgi:hypothetical protein
MLFFFCQKPKFGNYYPLTFLIILYV